MTIRLECVAEDCEAVVELPDGATVKGKPARQWFRDDCDYRCRIHRSGTVELEVALDRLITEFNATQLVLRKGSGG